MSSALERHQERFRRDPGNNRAFEALGEHLFLGGEWDSLIDLYERRLTCTSARANRREKADLMFRLGQIWEERIGQIDKAVECYRETLRADSQHLPALGQMRGIHASRAQWDVVLQIAEMEVALPMPANERAELLTGIGTLWLEQLGDPEQSLAHFQRALAESADHGKALEGAAVGFERLGRHPQAAEAWRRRVPQLRGTDRAAALVKLARLTGGPLGQPDAAAELYRKALTDDPMQPAAVEALTSYATARGQWALLADLGGRRFELATRAGDVARQAAIALETGRLHLESLHEPASAETWLNRARELAPSEAGVYQALGDLAREREDDPALLECVEQLLSLTDDAPPLSALLEAATMRSERGEHDQALPHLERAVASAPEDALVVEALSETLSHLGDYPALVDALERRAALAVDDPETRSAVLVELATVQRDRLQNPDAAREAFELAFDSDPKAQGLVAILEQTYRKVDDVESLRSLYERAGCDGPVERRPHHLCLLGEHQGERLGDTSEARRSFERALEIDPAWAPAHEGLQKRAQEDGDREALEHAYALEVPVARDTERLAFLVGELVSLCEARHQTAEALDWASQLATATPESAPVLLECARLQEKLGRRDDLLATLGNIEPLLAGSALADHRRRIAALHRDAGRHDASIATFQNALAANPEDREALESLLAPLETAGRLDELARARRQLADLLPPAERATCLNELATLLTDRLGDTNGGIEILTELCQGPREFWPADDMDGRLEAALERAGRYEELAVRLAERIEAFGAGHPEAGNLELRRANLLLDHLDRFREAADAFERARQWGSGSERASEGLERALRAAGDANQLAAFLLDRVNDLADPLLSQRAAFERAVLLEDELGDEQGAREAIASLADTAEDRGLRHAASRRLQALLERTSAWSALREHLEAVLTRAEADDPAELHERIAELCRDRLNDPVGAVAHFEAAAAVDPGRADLWRALAHLYDRAGRSEDLVQALEGELETGPSPERELTLRGRAVEVCAGALSDVERARMHAERVIELDATHSAATEFLIDFWERAGQASAVVRLLENRLQSLRATSPAPGGSDALRMQQTSLQLRIAAVRSAQLDDVDGAIAALEQALDDVGPRTAVAEPLADLYEGAGYDEELLDVCRRAADANGDPSERANWLLRLGAALCERRQDGEALDVYRRVLTDRPDDREAQAALRDLYRRGREPEPLARLLEVKLCHATGLEEIEARLELADLLADPLGKPQDGLRELRRVLQLDPARDDVRERTVQLAERMGDHDTVLQLIDEALVRPRGSDSRAALLARRGSVLADSERLAEACDAYREALRLDAMLGEARGALRRCLERLGRHAEVLDCLYQESCNAQGEARVALLTEAAEFARVNISLDAALPWLQRLRRERPTDDEIASRITDVHRRAGRAEALLRALEEEVALTTDTARWRELSIERAGLLESAWKAPARAARVLEEVRETAPGADVLENLERLYRATDRSRERVDVIEELVAWHGGSSPALAPLHREAAALCEGSLRDPERASHHWYAALCATPPGSQEHIATLRSLANALRASQQILAWSRCGEAELAALDPSQPVFEERRQQLHAELAGAYEQELGRPDHALGHLRALVDSLSLAEPSKQPGARAPGAEFDEPEKSLLRLLRAHSAWIELERRLTRRLERITLDDRQTDDPEAWLELARLRDDPIRDRRGAATAYRHVLEIEPDCLPALQGLRGTCERLCEWAEVASTLEREIEHAQTHSPGQRAALLGRLGDLYWHRLESTTGASRAYAMALEANPSDIDSLRSFEKLLESMEDWRGAMDLYESEVETLGDANPDRRYEVWLRIGDIARAGADDPHRALRAYRSAAAIQSLPPARTLDLATLHRECGSLEDHAEVFGTWCDDPASGARCVDHVSLADTQSELGHADAAQRRIDRALEIDDGFSPAWDVAARLALARGESENAAAALERAASLLPDPDASIRLQRAARIVESTDRNRALAQLRKAVERDAGNATACLDRARLAESRGFHEEAEKAAEQALELLASPPASEGPAEELRELSLCAALIGGRSAVQRGRLDAASTCYAEALASAPDHPEALAGYAETLGALGDFATARRPLERLLSLESEAARRPLHLTLLARGLELDDEPDAAIARLEEALHLEPGLDLAHERLVAIHEANADIANAVAALEHWAEIAANPSQFGARMLRAAEWELADSTRHESAERHLRAVLEAQPDSTSAWRHLAKLLWDASRSTEALEVASRALSAIEETGRNDADLQAARAPLALIMGRALEEQDARREAARAFAIAAEADPDCIEAALSTARLLRALGEWTAAAEALETFASRHPEDDGPGLAEVLEQLGRLLAGPLEEVDRSVTVYRRAIALDPSRREVRASLAELLSHRPGDFEEARGHHRVLLEDEPADARLLRVVLRSAEQRGADSAAATGRRILESLGAAGASDMDAPAAEPTAPLAGNRKLSDPLWEKLRSVANESAKEIAEALGASGQPSLPGAGEAHSDFQSARLAAEAELLAPALLPLSDEKVGEVLTLIAALVIDPETVRGDGQLVNSLSAALGRRTRRRLRNLLAGESVETIEQMDFTAWRRECRGLAAAMALDATQGSLRDVLVALVCEAQERDPSEFAEGDISALVGASPEARALLRRAVRSWLSSL